MAITRIRNSRLELRLPSEVKSLLQQAADTMGKKLSEFVIDSARREAVNVVADRRVFQLDKAQMAEFEAILNRPVQKRSELKKCWRQTPFSSEDHCAGKA